MTRFQPGQSGVGVAELEPQPTAHNGSELAPGSDARASPLIPLWEGWSRDDAAMLGGFTIIGCSLPPGDPYVLQVVHRIGTAYGSGRNAT